MKVIISHDIDHWSWTEHVFKDFYIQKFLVKNIYLGLSGKISLEVLRKRLLSMFNNRINRIDELINFDEENGVHANYFVGVANGLSLSYSYKRARAIIETLVSRNLNVGVHGISYDKMVTMKQEHDLFSAIIGNRNFGIRNHYLRHTDNTLKWMNDIGYPYDSSIPKLENPWKVGDMIEFPISIMDVNILSISSNDLEAAKNVTKNLFKKAKAKNLSFFTIIYHDNYFAEHYPLHMNWYKWLIPWIKEQGYDFCNFEEALELMKID